LKTIIPSNLNLTSDQIRELAQLESWDIFSFNHEIIFLRLLTSFMRVRFNESLETKIPIRGAAVLDSREVIL
jgi:hypothetical protein